VAFTNTPGEQGLEVRRLEDHKDDQMNTIPSNEPSRAPGPRDSSGAPWSVRAPAR
jgi:hypothetical protein